jgi:hypothetical protein
MVIGEAEFTSRAFSNQWQVLARDELQATLKRDPSRHTSSGRLADGSVIELAPDGWGTVVATVGGDERGRIVRTSWWGRSWDLTADGFACELRSDPLPRRWSIRVGSEPVGRMAGGAFSYNHLDVHTDIGVPLVGLILFWHVLARPWEQAAAPGSLVAR